MDDFMIFLENNEKERQWQQQHQQQQQQQHQYQHPLFQHHTLPSVAAAAVAPGGGGQGLFPPTRYHYNSQHSHRQNQQQPQQRQDQYEQRQQQTFSSKRAGGGGLAVSPRRYFAIRKCPSLQGPAIFSCWEDCSYYIDSDEDNNNDNTKEEEVIIDPEFQVFDHLQKAVEYIEIYIIEEEGLAEKQQQQQNTSITANSTLVRSRKRSAQSTFQGDKTTNYHNPNRKKLPFASKGSTMTTGTESAAASDDDSDNDEDDDRPASPGITFAESIDETSRNNQDAKRQKQQRTYAQKRPRRQQQQQQQQTHAHHANANGDDDDDENEFNHMVQVYLDTVAAKKAIRTNPKLQSWIKKQRGEYEAFKNKSPNTTMTLERYTRLSDVKFPLEKKQPLSWEVRAKQWFEFCTKHGREPRKEDDAGLTKWGYLQRNKYERRQAGEKTNLTGEQIQRLTEYGFRWKFTGRKSSTSRSPKKSWEERLQELIEFKRLHGHTTPPALLPGIGTFVANQHYQYQRFLRGETTTMTKERIAKLHEIGFDFTSPADQREQRRAEERKKKQKRGKTKTEGGQK